MNNEIQRIDKIRLGARLACMAGWGPETNPHPEGTDARLVWQVAYVLAREAQA